MRGSSLSRQSGALFGDKIGLTLALPPFLKKHEKTQLMNPSQRSHSSKISKLLGKKARSHENTGYDAKIASGFLKPLRIASSATETDK